MGQTIRSIHVKRKIGLISWLSILQYHYDVDDCWADENNTYWNVLYHLGEVRKWVLLTI